MEIIAPENCPICQTAYCQKIDMDNVFICDDNCSSYYLRPSDKVVWIYLQIDDMQLFIWDDAENNSSYHCQNSNIGITLDFQPEVPKTKEQAIKLMQ